MNFDMKISVLDGFTLTRDDLSWAELAALGELLVWPRSAGAEIPLRIADAEVVIVNKVPLSRQVIETAPVLRYITVTATGFNVIDLQAARERGIPVSNVPSYGTSTVAQYAMSLLLELCNQVGKHSCSVKAGEWNKSEDWTYWKSPQVELEGLSLGIMGFGKIGKRLAALGHTFGMKILYCARSEAESLPFQCQRVSLEELFTRSDVISLHSSLSEGAAGIIDKRLLRLMKPSAFLINTARGQLVNESDLACALRDGVLAGAALDVLATEPPNQSSPLLSAPNCVITPHIAWSSLPARRRILTTTVENVRSFVAGAPVNVVNGI